MVIRPMRHNNATTTKAHVVAYCSVSVATAHNWSYELTSNAGREILATGWSYPGTVSEAITEYTSSTVLSNSTLRVSPPGRRDTMSEYNQAPCLHASHLHTGESKPQYRVARCHGDLVLNKQDDYLLSCHVDEVQTDLKRSKWLRQSRRAQDHNLEHGARSTSI